MTGEELALIRLAAAVAQGGDERLDRAVAAVLAAKVDPLMAEEGILMAIVAVGFPRTLIAMRAWRKASGLAPRVSDGEDGEDYYVRYSRWTVQGEATCRVVYGPNYERLRQTVRDLHPALDAWMITEGYGRTLSRPGLTLRQRELLMVAMCAVLDVPHQLHSHLKGALHAGATAAEVGEALEGAIGGVSAREQEQGRQLWRRVAPSPDPSP
jgi:4-carboxymuconolactone decarboxylase